MLISPDFRNDDHDNDIESTTQYIPVWIHGDVEPSLLASHASYEGAVHAIALFSTQVSDPDSDGKYIIEIDQYKNVKFHSLGSTEYETAVSEIYTLRTDTEEHDEHTPGAVIEYGNPTRQCPVCSAGDENLNDIDHHFGFNRTYCTVTCGVCDSTWDEFYTFGGIDNVMDRRDEEDIDAD